MVELASTTAIKAAVASGTGPGVLSRLATLGDVQDGRLVIVPTEGLSLERSIRVVWAPNRPLSSAATRFLRLIGGPSA
jgi:DNA-binding transcriptional LysR family regulator